MAEVDQYTREHQLQFCPASSENSWVRCQGSDWSEADWSIGEDVKKGAEWGIQAMWIHEA